MRLFSTAQIGPRVPILQSQIMKDILQGCYVYLLMARSASMKALARHSEAGEALFLKFLMKRQQIGDSLP